jgi:hypothetical protein
MCAGLLAALGAANMHQRNFPVFLTAVLGMSALAVAIFVLTASPSPLGGEGRVRGGPQ